MRAILLDCLQLSVLIYSKSSSSSKGNAADDRNNDKRHIGVTRFCPGCTCTQANKPSHSMQGRKGSVSGS